MMQAILAPWPWYVAGPLITLVMFLLIYRGKTFGFSSNFRTLCAMCGAGQNIKFFDFNWRAQTWNLLFLVGTALGGFVAHFYLSDQQAPDLNPKTVSQLQTIGIQSAGKEYIPSELFGNETLQDPVHWVYLLVAGLFIGFGTRYAGGCTSGHSIMGMSNLQLGSLVATIGFFIGGLLMTHLIFPLLF